jgi:spore maturation protein CgeB
LHFEHNAQQDFYKSFCKQYIVQYYQNNQIAIEFKPDIIYTQCGAIDTNLLIELKEKTGAIVMQWTGNARAGILDEIMIYKDVSDITFLASGIGQKELYENALNQPVFYLQHGMASFAFKKVRTDITDNSIIFIGNNYDEFEGASERNNLCELLTNTFETFEVWGNGYADKTKYRNPDSIPYHLSHDLYNKSYIGIAANSFNYIDGYWSHRKLDIMAAGCCCLMRYVPRLEDYFQDMVHGVFYKTNQEAIEKINFLIANPDLRNKIAQQGQEIVQKYHTLDYRVIEIQEALKEFGK